VLAPRNRRRRLNSTLELPQKPEETEWVVPTRWLKQLIAIFLVPPAFILTRAFFSAFSRATINGGFWVSEEFWFFSLGSILWLIAFFGLSRPITMYVFGHELTHVIWVWMMGGRVSRFRVSHQGGHVVTDTNNFWIALAPYFFPLYSIVVVLIYGCLGAFMDLQGYHRWLFAAVGFTWAFHITFTLWMLWNGQTDLVEHGTFFSMMVIYIMNFLVMSLMLIVASRQVTFLAFGRELFQGAIDFSDWLLRLSGAKG
jgi:hypothetical protein